MFSRKFNIILFMLFVHFFAFSCYGGSIWAKRGGYSKTLYSDDKASQIGDVLTIIIDEDSLIDTDVERDLSNTNTRTIDLDPDDNLKDAPFSWLPGINGITDSFSASSNKSTSGSSTLDDTRIIKDRITVVVEDIHPNGNLVVIGSRYRDFTGDKQIIQVSGIVRPRDILFDNTIKSEQVADFRIVSINEGVSDNYNRVGWLGKVFDALWPF